MRGGYSDIPISQPTGVSQSTAWEAEPGRTPTSEWRDGKAGWRRCDLLVVTELAGRRAVSLGVFPESKLAEEQADSRVHRFAYTLGGGVLLTSRFDFIFLLS